MLAGSWTGAQSITHSDDITSVLTTSLNIGLWCSKVFLEISFKNNWVNSWLLVTYLNLQALCTPQSLRRWHWKSQLSNHSDHMIGSPGTSFHFEAIWGSTHHHLMSINYLEKLLFPPFSLPMEFDVKETRFRLYLYFLMPFPALDLSAFPGKSDLDQRIYIRGETRSGWSHGTSESVACICQLC